MTERNPTVSLGQQRREPGVRCRSLLLLLGMCTLFACKSPVTPTPTAPSATPSAIASATATELIAPTSTSTPTSTSALTPTAAPTKTSTAEPTATATKTRSAATPMPSRTPTLTVQEALQSTMPYVYCLVVTPDDPPAYLAVANNRLFRSKDRGQNWGPEPMEGVPGSARVLVLAIDYRHPDTMYLGTDQGLYRQEGADNTWQFVHTMVVSALAVDLENPDILYAGTGWGTELEAVLVKSEDRGRTWGGADHGMQRGQVTAILIDPNQPNVLWAHLRPAFNRAWPYGQIYRGGRDGSWERLSLGQYDMREFTGKPGTDTCSPAGLAYDPNSNSLYTGCDITYYGGTRRYWLLRSTNADSPDSSLVSWELVADWGPVPDDFAGFNTIRPLAVDAREPRSVLVFVDTTRRVGAPEFQLKIGHDDGSKWESLVPVGLGGNGLP